jgi:protease I
MAFPGNTAKQIKKVQVLHGEHIAILADEEFEADDFDAITVPGGYAADKMRLHQPVIDLLRKAHDLGKVVAVDLKNAGANWVDEPVVRDGNVITSRKPVDLPPFYKAIIEALTA